PRPRRAVRFQLALHSPRAHERNLPPCRRAGQAGGTPTNETEFSHRTRAKALAAMAAEPVDVLVVGGGITGAGITRDPALRGFRTVRLHRWLGRKATLRLEPGLRDKDLRGAAVYFDAQTDDARLTLATMRAAAQAGALVASHADVTALLKPDGRIRGAAVRDMLSGDEYSVRALVVVNATG